MIAAVCLAKNVHAQVIHPDGNGHVVTNDSDNAVKTDRSRQVERRYRSFVRKLLESVDDDFRSNMPPDVQAFITSGRPEGDLPLDMDQRYPVPVTQHGVLVVLLDPLTAAPLAQCETPCSLPGRVGELLPVLLIGGGHLPQFGWHGADAPKTGMGANYLEGARRAGECAAAYDARPPVRPDADAEPCLRLPPRMPPRATRSGHCRMQFDVTRDGFVQNLRTLSCSDPVFKSASEFTTSLWFYHPAWSSGQAVARTNVETKISFALTDEHGNAIPE